MTHATDTDITYNGWTNYETWAMGMFLDGNYTGPYTPEQVAEIVKPLVESKADVMDALKEYVEHHVYTDADEAPSEVTTTGIVGDLLGAALGAVDWCELAEHKIQEVSEDEC